MQSHRGPGRAFLAALALVAMLVSVVVLLDPSLPARVAHVLDGVLLVLLLVMITVSAARRRRRR